jgi:mono/diheme cytochrome c family protein
MFRGHEVCAITLLSLLPIAVGCTQDMADQPKSEPFESSDFFTDGQASRPLVSGTVARGQLRIDSHFYTGQTDGKPVDTFPESVTEELLLRGQQRFNIFCAPCHDRVGNGQGTVVRRGFPQPPSYHNDRLRELPIGSIYDAVTNGSGRMPDHAAQIPPRDRWAIVAYVRALQLSQHADRKRLSAEDLQQLGPPAKRDTPARSVSEGER